MEAETVHTDCRVSMTPDSFADVLNVRGETFSIEPALREQLQFKRVKRAAPFRGETAL